MILKRIKELGRGGFGRVFEVVNTVDNQHYALKVFEPNEELRLMIARGEILLEDLKRRFLKEVKYQCQISSENVVKIFHYDLNEEFPWYVMELGIGTLKDDLNVDKSFGGNPKKALFDILAGLEAIHYLGIVHRDLKPVNIIKLPNQDGTFRYAISDFGLITAVHSDTTTITKTGHGGGTAIYAAPELLSNFRHATSVADIYSFGAILHDIFGTGIRHPYAQLSVPEPCKKIVEKCTHKNGLRRYQDVTDLRSDLTEVLETAALTFSSPEEEEVIGLLQTKDKLTDDEWDMFFELLNKSSEEWMILYKLFLALRTAHFTELASTAPGLLNALGMEFSSYTRRYSHNFNYCDVLADKLEAFFNLGKVALKAHCLITLLMMGVGHNRWFVERKLLVLANHSCDDVVIDRLLMDVETDSIDLRRFLMGWHNSLGLSLELLHPKLYKFASNVV